jgi:hypothetical protein
MPMKKLQHILLRRRDLNSYLGTMNKPEQTIGLRNRVIFSDSLLSVSSDSLWKIPDNIAVSFLPDFESLSKKALVKGLNYFTQGYIHNIKISEAHGAMRVDARCWRDLNSYLGTMNKPEQTIGLRNRVIFSDSLLSV